MSEQTPMSEPQTATSAAGQRPIWPALACLAVVAATAGELYWQGRRGWCACGTWAPLSGDAWGSHNSQHLLDPYSFAHLLHGLLFFGLLVLVVPRLALMWRFVLCVGLECGWEIFENSAFTIARYRATTASLGYEGDAIGNSMGDILSCALGFWVASRLGFWKSFGLIVAVELLLLFWIRDSLGLNVVMLVYPLDDIRAWQTAG